MCIIRADNVAVGHTFWHRIGVVLLNHWNEHNKSNYSFKEWHHDVKTERWRQLEQILCSIWRLRRLFWASNSTFTFWSHQFQSGAGWRWVHFGWSIDRVPCSWEERAREYWSVFFSPSSNLTCSHKNSPQRVKAVREGSVAFGRVQYH